MSIDKSALKTLIGIHPPEGLCKIIERILLVDECGLKEAIRVVEDLITMQIHDLTDDQDYQMIPTEFSPFIVTGGDGCTVGHVVLAPELNLKDYPIIERCPGDGYVHLYGNTTLEAFNYMINAYNEYSESDASMLANYGFEYNPSLADKPHYTELSDKPESEVDFPVQIPEGYHYQLTSDSLGVLAPAHLFNPSYIALEFKSSIDLFIENAVKDLRKGFYGSALRHLKEGWYSYYFDEELKFDIILGLLSFTYERLDRPSQAARVWKDRLIREDRIKEIKREVQSLISNS